MPHQHDPPRAGRLPDNAAPETDRLLAVSLNEKPFAMGIIELVEGDLVSVSHNPGAAEFFGVPPSELQGGRLSALGVPQATLCDWVARCKESRAIGRRVRFEGDMPTANGPRWVCATIAPLRPHHDSPDRFIYCIEDASARRSLESATQQAREEQAARLAAQAAEREIAELNRTLANRVEELQALLRILPVGIAIAQDPECRSITGNAAFARMLGLPEEANMSRTAPEPDRPRNFHEMRDGRAVPPEELPMQVAAAQGRDVPETGIDLVHDDGHVVTLYGYASPLFDERGKVRGSVGAFLDISALKQTQDALKESERQYHTLVDTLPQLVWTCNAAGESDFVSRQWMEYTGAPAEEHLGYGWTHAVHPDDLERVVSTWRAAVEARSPVSMDFRIRRSDGAYLWFETRGVPIVDEAGNVLRWLGSCTDIDERTKADEARSESEERFRATFEQAAVGMAHVDLDGRWLRVNQRLCDILGYSREELMRKTYQEITHPDDLEADEAQAARLVAGEIPFYRLEKRYIRKDGSPVWVVLTGSLTRNEDGTPRDCVAVVQDISARKKAEQALRESEEFNRRILESSHDCIEVLSLDGRLLSMNEGGRALLAVGNFAHLENTAWLDAWIGESHEAALQAAREGGVGTFEGCRPTLAGEPKWWDVIVSPILGSDNRPERLLAISRDITERRSADERLREASQLLRYHVENSPLAVVEFDTNFNITRWSEEATRVFGWTAEEMLGKRMFEIPWIYPEDLPKVETVSQAMSSGKASRTVSPNRNIRKDGSTAWCEWYNSSLVDGEGNLVSILSLVLDVTERVHLEQELAARAEALAQADRAKDEFLAMLAHELRNPLGAISNATHLLHLRADRNTDLHRPLSILDRQVKHTARLVDDLLDVSRITRGKLELRKEMTDLTAVARRAAEAVQPQAHAVKHHLVVSVPREAMWLEGDQARLEQVIGNLLNNAIKYTDPGGLIQLHLYRDGDTATLRVQDNGNGISPEMLPRIFDMFVQEDRSLARSKGGLGIGLTLVQSLVQLHGGTVKAYSDGPGKGSTFVIRLPLEKAEPLRAVNPPAASPVEEALSILVVEDNEDISDSLAEILTSRGYSVKTTTNGASALETVEAFQPDVVLLDIGLPEMDGYEVARRLQERRRFKRATLIALTGYGQEEDRERSRQAGFHHHLVKPVDLDTLIKLLSDIGRKERHAKR